MRANLQQTAIAVSLTLISFSSFAQKKEFTEEQYFKSNFKGITQPLPQVVEWVDESHVVIKRDGKNFIIDGRSGKEFEYTMPAANKGSVDTKPEIITKSNQLKIGDNIEIRLMQGSISAEVKNIN